MGMAASQARFLSLTARKSNVEYEGQQVNQQRTALANESANLYNKLTSIKVPTPPSTSDYYETVYTFKTSELDNTSATANEYTLHDIYTMPDGTYANLSYMAYQWESASTKAYSGDIVSKEVDGKMTRKISLLNGVTAEATELTYQPTQANVKLDFTPNEEGQIPSVSIGGINFELDETTSQIKSKEPEIIYDVEYLGDGKYSLKLDIEQDSKDDDKFFCNIGGMKYEAVKQSNGVWQVTIPGGEENLPITVNGKYVTPDGNFNSAIGYLNDGFTSITSAVKNEDGSESPYTEYNQPILSYVLNNTTYYVSASEYKKGEGKSFESSSYVQNVGHPQKVSYPCVYTTASSGRYQTLTVTDDYGYNHTFDLTVTTVQDEEAYQQAMLDYEYEQSKYQKQVQDINAKTEALQQEDRTLELRLKQLDTEQNAISTEMDAVKKVIDDNVEATFKTFA